MKWGDARTHRLLSHRLLFRPEKDREDPKKNRSWSRMRMMRRLLSGTDGERRESENFCEKLSCIVCALLHDDDAVINEMLFLLPSRGFNQESGVRGSASHNMQTRLRAKHTRIPLCLLVGDLDHHESRDSQLLQLWTISHAIVRGL